jgi:hypothetical protein
VRRFRRPISREMSIRGSCKTRRTDLRYLCGLAPDLAALCACRALQALGAAMLQADSLGHHRPRGPSPLPRACHRTAGSGAGDRPGPGPLGGRPVGGGRGLAPDLLRQCPAGPAGGTGSPRLRAAKPESPKEGGLRPGGTGAVLPGRGGVTHRFLVRGDGGMGVPLDRFFVCGRGGAGGAVRAP